MKQDLISVVSPVYGDKRNVSLLYSKLVDVLSKMDIEYEIILVNDCCPYGSGEEIEKIAKQDTHVKFIDLSRNFGQHNAIKAGLDYAKGDWAVVMDCDLQDNPQDIIKFYKEAKKGFDVVWGIREKRKDSFLKLFLSKTYRTVEKKLSNYVTNYDHGNYSIISKKVLNEFKKINNHNFNYCTVIYYLGFKTSCIEIEKCKRAEGKSGYNFIKGVRLALKSIIANSNKPLIFATYCSLLMFSFAIVFIIKLLFDYYVYNNKLLGWTSIMVSIFFIGGLIFAYLAILGLYIGGVFKEVKHKPLYVVQKTMNLEDRHDRK